MFCKKLGSGREMSQYVDDACNWARVLVKRENRGWGDLPRAMRSVARHCGIDYSVMHDLRYRPPKRVDPSVYERLQSAYQDLCARQENLRANERTITKVRNPVAACLVRAADAIAGVSDTAAAPRPSEVDVMGCAQD